jgi:hypothetical protein
MFKLAECRLRSGYARASCPSSVLRMFEAIRFQNQGGERVRRS